MAGGNIKNHGKNSPDLESKVNQVFARILKSEKNQNEKMEELLSTASENNIPIHKLESYIDPKSAAAARRHLIGKITGTDLRSIGSSNLDYSLISNRNAENVIGYMQMPLGVAGPILINGEHAKGEFYVPMATTEGALIASVNRGMKAITSSGGAKTIVIKNAMTRAPVFEFDSIAYIPGFLAWIRENHEEIKRAAEATTSHGKLIDVMPFVTGANVWLRFSFDTGDAMGMNMVTIASEAACEYIESNFKKARLVSISGNMCSDKKISSINLLFGRGKSVIAEAILEEEITRETLKATTEGIHNLNIKKNLMGSTRAGSNNLNGHAANMVAAVFAATGQDIAQVVESSNCFTITELKARKLHISVTMPSIEVGTVGGGSGLPTQKEALSILGASGSGKTKGSNSLKLAEIIASTVLAGELNLLAAQFSRELGRAHNRLGRSKG